jgi:hypothetical protein
MKPQFRIKQTENCKFKIYYVESIGTSFFFSGKEVLKPYVTWSGLDQGYEFKTIEGAIEHLKAECIINTEII